MEEPDRVRDATPKAVQDRLDERRKDAVAALVGVAPQRITARLRELDAEWDVERVLAANAASLTLLGLGLSRVSSPRWLLMSAVVPGFLLQHALQGWCPPIAVLRRMGIRSRREIDAERTALKMLRGDFDEPVAGTPQARAEQAIRAAGRR